MNEQRQNRHENDPEQYNTRERLKAINEARRAVREKENDADGWAIQGVINRQTADTIVRRAVEHYIIELESVIREAQEEEIVSEDYWQGVKLGTMHLPSGDRVTFEGLESIIEAPPLIHDEWREEVEDDLTGSSFQHFEEQVQIDRDIVMAAYRACNRFCADINLDLDVSQAAVYEFKYEDILEEGPPDE